MSGLHPSNSCHTSCVHAQVWEESIRAHIIKVHAFKPFEVYARADRESGEDVLNAVRVGMLSCLGLIGPYG